MLTNETKRRIDNCRDILVGKLPDPKSQVEQITIALIYKFMDDMDRESEELGGVAKFFVEDFSKYKWANIMDKKSSGFERLNLYAEGIEKMTQNNSIPQLFRDIFKNAFLPYRDPETFNLFSKEINGFSYEHSEELGNAFEYLLSIMSSQGDAGQFRTPRHIIDFIVEVIEPKKNETILDPACGTAGFLISAYKYIQNKNSEKGLTPDEQERLTKNISGYDISPDMVRLSLVNLYLHSFPEPKIYEYDTLTSEDRWKDNFDVILANPPFMTPKGGIKPHSKFAIKANRSEVLFVDYIMEHININGRAGIIVPEGIIFQSANAYKSLRKKLIDDKYLWAVVSLPAGVFNPYSGVKTSILLMDREIAKKTDKILFVKVENDGYDLGAQRRKIDKDNLPEAVGLLREYREAIFSSDEAKLDKINDNDMAVIVEKVKVSENGDYNLSMDRYKEVIVHSHKKWEMDKLGNYIELIRGVTYKKDDEVSENGYEVLRANNIDVKTNKLIFDDIKKVNNTLSFSDRQKLKTNDIFICLASGSKEHIGKVAFINNDLKYYFGGFMGAVRVNQDVLYPKYIFELLKDNKFNQYLNDVIVGANINNLSSKILSEFKIPLPPISVQKEIVEEIEGYQKIIDGARAVVENWKPVIKIDEDWEMVELGDVFENAKSNINPKDFPNLVNYVGLENIESDRGNLIGQIETDGNTIKSNKLEFLKDDILYGKLRPNLNKVWLANFSGICSTDFIVLRAKEKILPNLYQYLLRDYKFNQVVLQGISGAQLPRIKYDYFSKIKIPLPDIKIQEKIVVEIEEEKKIVEANKRLIEIYEQKIKDKIAEVWGR